MAEQYEAITGRRVRRPYQSMIAAQSAHLPEVYAAKEQKQYQEQMAGQRAREFTLAEEAQKTQEKQSKMGTYIGMTTAGAAFGPLGAAAGLGAAVVMDIFDFF